MNRKSEVAEMMKECRRRGCRVLLSKRGHYRIYPPDKTAAPITAASSPSDWRSIRKLRADLRRAGVEIP
ncbi:hypothetical protein LCGC14_2292010 [marine sediment metagenome]|uniref:HicA protein n=1 Tax=marine sediment metagenome TaxID=412755 RepID=A0A0F9DDM3_9ZZZZ